MACSDASRLSTACPECTAAWGPARTTVSSASPPHAVARCAFFPGRLHPSKPPDSGALLPHPVGAGSDRRGRTPPAHRRPRAGARRARSPATTPAEPPRRPASGAPRTTPAASGSAAVLRRWRDGRPQVGPTPTSQAWPGPAAGSRRACRAGHTVRRAPGRTDASLRLSGAPTTAQGLNAAPACLGSPSSCS